jgi:hypothetical protein
MNYPKHFFLSVLIIMAASAPGFSQASTNVPVAITSVSNSAIVSVAPNSRGWTDPALDHNRLLQQQTSEGAYKVIGNFKVMGTPYLYGEHNKGDLFAPEAKAYNIFISYNTYNQELEFYSTSNPDKPLTREPGTVDSFALNMEIVSGINNRMKFIYGSLLGSKEKAYYMELYAGPRFSIYKRYKSDLGYVSSNYVQSELREFDLQVEYFYVDSQGKGVKKIKPNSFSVIKEFKDTKDLSTVVTVDDFTLNPDEAFKKAFTSLNN